MKKSFYLLIFVFIVVAFVSTVGYAIDNSLDEVIDKRPILPGSSRQNQSIETSGDSDELLLYGDVVLDSGAPVVSLSEDVHAIRQYSEFYLFMFVPLTISVLFVVVLCWWIYATFIKEHFL